ncbi:MAG: hypothetical protein ACFFAN_01950 [Promethearchaeota archaeon]
MKNEMEKMINKSKLTKEELKEYFKIAANVNRKLDHSRAYRTMMNELRRKLLKFIGYEVRSMDEIKNKFTLKEEELIYHLSMLKQCLYILESKEGWKSTPRGLGFLENAQMGGF